MLLAQLQKSQLPIVIFGAGVYAYVLKRFLEACAIPIESVMVDSAFCGTGTFIGLPPLILEDNLHRLAHIHVIVGITNFPPQVEKLKNAGALHVHVIDVPDYLNMPHPFMDLAFVKAHEQSFEQGYHVWADELSQRTYFAAIQGKINEDLAQIAPWVKLDDLYFPHSEFPLHQHESLLDVGGFTGDTVREFILATGGKFEKIISLEPDAKNFHQLQLTALAMGPESIVSLQIGAWDEKATLKFASKSQQIDNQISDQGMHEIDVDTIDAILQGIGQPNITLMKLDINGAERKALLGAADTIRRCRPRIITRLHTKEDFYQIPLLLKQIAPGMKLYLRQRNHVSLMLVLYGSFESTV
jgi:FkbM family methyltransferase